MALFLSASFSPNTPTVKSLANAKLKWLKSRRSPSSFEKILSLVYDMKAFEKTPLKEDWNQLSEIFKIFHMILHHKLQLFIHKFSKFLVLKIFLILFEFIMEISIKDQVFFKLSSVIQAIISLLISEIRQTIFTYSRKIDKKWLKLFVCTPFHIIYFCFNLFNWMKNKPEFFSSCSSKKKGYLRKWWRRRSWKEPHFLNIQNKRRPTHRRSLWVLFSEN